MAIQQTQDWRIREAINKKIQRQIEQDLTPLTRYKRFFPYTANADLIDRRTGKVKMLNDYVTAYVRDELGTKQTFIEEQMKKGVSAKVARELYTTHRAASVVKAKASYSKKLNILAGMDITSTKEAREYNYARAEAVVQLYLARLVGRPGYDEAAEKLLKMSPAEQVDAIRVAKRRSCPDGVHQTLSFYEMLGEYLNIEYPHEPPTP